MQDRCHASMYLLYAYYVLCTRMHNMHTTLEMHPPGSGQRAEGRRQRKPRPTCKPEAANCAIPRKAKR